MEVKESGLEVLRVILPDADGNLDKSKMHEVYAEQHDALGL